MDDRLELRGVNLNHVIRWTLWSFALYVALFVFVRWLTT